jgi:hypothetical protein
LPYLDCPKVVPEHVKRVAAELQCAAPFTERGETIDVTYAEHRRTLALLASPAPKEPDAEDGVEWK